MFSWHTVKFIFFYTQNEVATDFYIQLEVIYRNCVLLKLRSERMFVFSNIRYFLKQSHSQFSIKIQLLKNVIIFIYANSEIALCRKLTHPTAHHTNKFIWFETPVLTTTFNKYHSIYFSRHLITCVPQSPFTSFVFLSLFII